MDRPAREYSSPLVQAAPARHTLLWVSASPSVRRASPWAFTAAALVHELMEARDERRLLRLQKQMGKLLIIDELGFVPLSKTGAELLFELISQRYERGATLITSNLPFRMDRNLRLRAYRRASGPPDPSRQHPRDERRQLSSGPKPGPQRHRHQLRTDWPSRAKAPRHPPAISRAQAPGRPPHSWCQIQDPQVANIWPTFAPPHGRFLLRR